MMNLYEVARFLEAHDNYDILTHAYPDGDTLGSGFALCLALRQIGKKARVITTGVPSKFTYLQKNIEEEDFTTETVVSVDVAADSLLGSNMGKYIGKVDLCIDHHGSNTFTAKEKFVDKYAAATQRSLSSTGTNFYTVSDGEGAIRIMEYYREWIGDWSNWFWVKLNIDTLEVFYCYYSAACERNLSDYDSDDYYNVSAMIMDLAGAVGFDGFDYYTRESVTDNMPFEVDITNSVTGESLRYECRMHTYSDAASLLVDREYTLVG